jgi:hypothetical protein
VIVFVWWDGQRHRLTVGQAGRDGIEAGKPYRCIDGRIVPEDRKARLAAHAKRMGVEVKP